MKALLAICLILTASFAWATETGVAQGTGSATVQGKVLEVKSVDNFTYLRLKTSNGEVWAAVINAKAKKGETVVVENVSVMHNFQSKALNRTFKEILFGTLGGTGKTAADTSASGAPLGMYLDRKRLDKISDAPVSKAGGENAMTIEEIVRQSTVLKGKPVVVRGKVVKYNAEIMGVNWIHLQDGSGSAADGSNDILVTTLGTAKVGDVVTASGTVETDKVFGAGYAYKVLIEKATLQK